MIFITLGSQKFQFDRLLAKVDELVENGIIKDEVFAQSGASTYIPKNYKYKNFLDKNEFSELTSKADVVITHGGTGAIIGAVKKGKKVIAVPRLKEFNEHVDDHQIQLLKEFSLMNIIEACFDLSELGEKYKKALDTKYNAYSSNTQKYLDAIDDYLK